MKEKSLNIVEAFFMENILYFRDVKLITARIFDNPIDAHLLKSKLESEGIYCYLKDEHTITIDPLVSNAIGGIKLQIKNEDVEKAKKVLKEIENTPYRDEEGNIAVCPNCDSKNLISNYISTKGFKEKLSAIITLLFASYPFYLNKVFKCKECGNEFKLK